MTRRIDVVLPFLLLALLATPALAEDLDDPDEKKLEGAEKKKHDRAVKKLVYTLKKHKSNEVLWAHIGRLGNDATRVGRDALMKFVTGNKNQATASRVFLALSDIGDKSSLRFLCGKHALRSRSFLIQETAINALGESEDRRVVGPLVEVMRSKRSKEAVIEACGYALGRCGPSEDLAAKALLDFSKYTKSSVRLACLAALGKTGTDAAYKRLVQALTKDTNTQARGTAAAGLGHLGRREALPHLKAALKREGSTQVTAKIIKAIADIG